MVHFAAGGVGFGAGAAIGGGPVRVIFWLETGYLSVMHRVIY